VDLILTTRAIYKLRPGTEWILDEHTGLKFIDPSITVPTDSEIAEAIEEILADDKAKADAKAKAKASAEAKFAALGLTVDEIAALLSQ
jgi:hypothetical protein